MSETNANTPRRVNVGERNIYRRPDGKLEVVYKDSTGVQRYEPVQGGIMAARKVRDEIAGRKARGEHVQPNPRLTFGEAADRWLAQQVCELRPSTRSNYEGSVRLHLRERWGTRKIDTLTVDDAARLVRELRASGMSEWSINGVLKAASRVFTFAARRLAWHGVNPITLLEPTERARIASTERRRIFEGAELADTLAAAEGRWRVLFSLAAVTGARLSEVLGLRWEDLDLADTSEASIRIAHQVDTAGERQPLKTEESRRTVEIPAQLALMLKRHEAGASHCAPGDFVFATATGRPISQRNAGRALRRVMKAARTVEGRATFPILSKHDEKGDLAPVPRGAVPSFHSFRHSAASQAFRDGDSAEEVSWQLGHKNSVVTRTVYLRELRDIERVAERRSRMTERYGSVLDRADLEREPDDAPAAEVVPLRKAVS